MNYQPLKKQITFSDEVKADANFSSVMALIKSLGHPEFKAWFLSYVNDQKSQLPCQQTCDKLTAIADIFSDMVSRTAQVDLQTLNQSQSFFIAICNDNLPALCLTHDVLKYLASVQKAERLIQTINHELDHGVLPTKPLTRDGKDAVLLPRSRFN